MPSSHGDPACLILARQRGRPSPAIMPRNEDVVGLRLGHPRSHGAYSHFRNKLDADVRRRIGVFQVVNQLGQIFNRVNVVMWGRADQRHTRSGVT